MRKPFAAVLVLSFLFLLVVSSPGNPENGSVHSDTAAQSSSGEEQRGAGYLPYTEPTPQGYAGLFSAIMRTIFSLAVVLGLLYVTLWFIRKVTGTVAGSSSQGAVRVVGRIYLSPKIVVYFLRLLDRLLVVGTSGGSISLLMTIEDEREIALIEDALKGLYGTGPGFSRLFDKSMAKFQKALESREDSGFDDQLRTLNDQIGRLRGLARKRKRDDE